MNARSLAILLPLAACASHPRSAPVPVRPEALAASPVPVTAVAACGAGNDMPVHSPSAPLPMPTVRAAPSAPIPNACAGSSSTLVVWTPADSVTVDADSAGIPR